jgi:hypothetical protein
MQGELLRTMARGLLEAIKESVLAATASLLFATTGQSSFAIIEGR